MMYSSFLVIRRSHCLVLFIFVGLSLVACNFLLNIAIHGIILGP